LGRRRTHRSNGPPGATLAMRATRKYTMRQDRGRRLWTRSGSRRSPPRRATDRVVSSSFVRP
jgi:hypothetical protein